MTTDQTHIAAPAGEVYYRYSVLPKRDKKRELGFNV